MPTTARDTGLIWSEPDQMAHNQWMPDEHRNESSIDGSILSVNVSYSMDLCAQVTAVIHDPGFAYAKANYFWITRDVWYRSHSITSMGTASNSWESKYLTQMMEIGSAKLGPSAGTGAQWTCQMRTKAIQQMKRGKGDENDTYGIAGQIVGAGHTWVQNAAEMFGLKTILEETDKSHEVKPFQSGDEASESSSVWDVIKGIASAANFVVFEADGVLFFCSHQFLLGAWGIETGEKNVLNPETNQRESRVVRYVPIRWPRDPSAVIQVMGMPTVSKSDNDPFEVQGSMLVDRTNGTSLRPGMTILLQGIPMFGPMLDGSSPSGDSGLYLITSVDYDHLGTKPVSVSFRSPTKKKDQLRNYTVGNTRIEPMQSSAQSGRSEMPGTFRTGNISQAAWRGPR